MRDGFLDGALTRTSGSLLPLCHLFFEGDSFVHLYRRFQSVYCREECDANAMSGWSDPRGSNLPHVARLSRLTEELWIHDAIAVYRAKGLRSRHAALGTFHIENPDACLQISFRCRPQHRCTWVAIRRRSQLAIAVTSYRSDWSDNSRPPYCTRLPALGLRNWQTPALSPVISAADVERVSSCRRV